MLILSLIPNDSAANGDTKAMRWDRLIRFNRAAKVDKRFGNLRNMTQAANRARGSGIHQALKDKLLEYSNTF